MGATNVGAVMTLANSIIGVSILAMPYCFKQCGIVLASLILILSSILTRLSCHYLLKSAIMSRRRNFEFLAFHVFGSTGKVAIELCIIFLMIGTSIAFFVVMGDLGPEIIGTLLDFKNSAALRPSVLIGLAVFVVLPLGMLRNVDSLSAICTASFIFYFSLVVKVFMESTNNLFFGNWLTDIHFWRPSGLLQCLPIFSMALSCQTQLFEIFDSVPNATLDRMNVIVRSAINVCTGLYISVGFFGYVAYYKQNITVIVVLYGQLRLFDRYKLLLTKLHQLGNLLMSFSESVSSDIFKIGFVLSVAVTFPLVIFPCRASLNSLLFSKVHVPHYELVTGGGNHIPEPRFKCITLFIISVSLTTGLLAPNIEIVLGLLGSTIGVVICILFPPIIFIWICTKVTSERLFAEFMVAIGIFIMVMGTYANLYLAEQSTNVYQIKNMEHYNAPVSNIPPVIPHKDGPIEVIKSDANKVISELDMKLAEKKIQANDDSAKSKVNKIEIVKSDGNKEETRIEPPIPIAPDSANQVVVADQNKVDNLDKSKLENVASNKEVKIEMPLRKIENAEKQKLIQNQKDIIQQMREENQNAKVISNPDEISKHANDEQIVQGNKENEANVKNKEVFDKEKILVKEQANEAHKENDFIDSKIKINGNLSKILQDAVPLPILIQNGNSNLAHKNEQSDNKEKVDPVPADKVIQRDILENDKKLQEREKRDLVFVTKENTDAGGAAISISTDEEFNSKIITKEKQLDSFVSNIVEKNKKACAKTKTQSDNTSNENIKILTADGSLKAVPSKYGEQSEIIDLDANKKIDVKKVDAKPSSKVMQNGVVEQLKNAEYSPLAKVDTDKVVDNIINGDAVKEINVAKTEVKFDTSKRNANKEVRDVTADSSIIVPSKLSNPNLLVKTAIGENSEIIKNIKPMKPMKRDLKSVPKENSKKNKK